MYWPCWAWCQAAQGRAALHALQPLKAALVRKLEKLRAQDDAATADAAQFLIQAQEAKFARVVAQERQLKIALATVEARMAELKRDPDVGPFIEAEEQIKAAAAEQEALFRALPRLPGEKRE